MKRFFNVTDILMLNSIYYYHTKILYVGYCIQFEALGVGSEVSFLVLGSGYCMQSRGDASPWCTPPPPRGFYTRSILTQPLV